MNPPSLLAEVASAEQTVPAWGVAAAAAALGAAEPLWNWAAEARSAWGAAAGEAV